MSTAPVRAVFLTGFMGAGKTAAGEALASRLGWRFVDLDARVEAREGRSIAEIFRADGEAGFRSAESAALREVIAELREGATVVALGGGTIAEPQNAAAIGRSGALVFLDAPLDVLRRRAEAGEGRPLLGLREEFATRYASRLSAYRGADLTVSTETRSAAEVAAEIATRLGLEQSRTGRGEGDKK
jgi:shikimate kinase